MEIMQKIGEKAKGLGEKAKDLGGRAREVTKRSGELLEIARLRYDLSRLEREMDNNLHSLGELVYRRHKGEESLDAEIERLVGGTAQVETEIKVMSEQIRKLQPKPLTCPQCKIELPLGGKYCSYCGSLVAEEKEK